MREAERGGGAAIDGSSFYGRVLFSAKGPCNTLSKKDYARVSV